jgi:hypothetical protein
VTAPRDRADRHIEGLTSGTFDDGQLVLVVTDQLMPLLYPVDASKLDGR